MKSSGQRILVDPEEILIEKLEIGKSHIETISVTNSMSVPVTIEFKPHPTNERRHEIEPATLRLGSLETIPVQVKTTLLKYPKYTYVIRDVVTIKSEYFTEKFYISIRPKGFAKEEVSRETNDVSSRKVERLEEELAEYQREIQRLSGYLEEKEGLEAELGKVRKENSELKAALEDANRSSLLSQKITDMYKEKVEVENMVELRLQEEVEKNERKNAKVLEILKLKDLELEQAYAKAEEWQREVSELNEKLKKVKGEVEPNHGFSGQTRWLERQIKDQEDAVSNSNNLKFEGILKENQNKILYLNSALMKLQEENTRLRNREEGVLLRQELSKSPQDKIAIEKDQIIYELQSKVISQSNYIESLISKLSSASYQETLSKLKNLEEENRILSAQLADSTGKAPSDFSNILQENEQLTFEISLKNREVIELQNQVILLQRKKSSNEGEKNFSSEQEKVLNQESQIIELNNIIRSLEQSNQDLQNQLKNALQGVSSENFVQNLASQTQLVTRLNARVLNLKEREDQALKKLEEAEEVIKELKQLVEDERMKGGKKSVKHVLVQTTGIYVGPSENENFEIDEKKIVDVSKGNTSYQNKHYDHMKNGQMIKTRSQEQLQEKVLDPEKSSADLSSRYADGESPEDYKSQYQQLMMELSSLRSEKQRIEEEFVACSMKYQTALETIGAVKEELEIYKNAMSENRVIFEEVKAQKTGKKLTLERSKSNPTYRLIRALVAAKLGEADVVKKLKMLSEAHLKLQESTDNSTHLISSLENQLTYLLRYMRLQKCPPPAELDFQPANEEKELNKAYVQSLEKEISDLKILRLRNWCEITPLSRVLAPIDFPQDEVGNLLEGIIYLSDLLSDEKFNEKPNLAVEKIQRLVIRALHKSIKGLIKPTDGLASLLEYKPSDKEDRQLWYVELLESQLETFNGSITSLIDFTNKVSIDVTGNLLSAGQYKGAAMDLAKATKESANELETLKSLCTLIKSDMVELKKRDENCVNPDYKERAFLAEALKRKLEEEIIKLKMDNSYKLAELEEYERCLKEENQNIREYQEQKEKSIIELQKELSRIINKASKLELELKNTSDRLIEQQKLNQDLSDAKETLIKKLEKFQKDQKNKLFEVQDQITSKDKLILEVQKQNKILQDERGRVQTEVNNLKKKNKELKIENDEIKDKKDTERELQELREARRASEESKTEIKRNQEAHKTEIEKLLGVISELEHKYKKIRAKYGKAKNYICSKVKSKEEDADLLKHTHNAQIITMKNKSKEKVRDLSSQIVNLQTLLKEKMSELDSEIKKRCENEEKQNNYSNFEIESQRKIAVLEEKLKNLQELYEQETKRLAQDLDKAKKDHEKLVLRLQENFTSAELLTEFITKSEQEKRDIESSYKADISSLTKKEKEKDTYIDALKKKVSELTEKNNQYEGKFQDLSTIYKEIDDFKRKITDLTNTKAQQRAKIKELELRIKDFESDNDSNKQRYMEKLDDIRKEIQSSYEEFEKTVSKYQGQIEGLKEQYTIELRKMKGAKKAAESMDSMFQIVRRDGMIKALKKELKLKDSKGEKKRPESEQQEEVIVLQNQVYKLKAIIKNLEHQLGVVKEEAQKLRAEIDLTMEMNDEIKEKDFYTRKEMVELKKRHKIEMQGLLEEYNRLLYNKKS